MLSDALPHKKLFLLIGNQGHRAAGVPCANQRSDTQHNAHGNQRFGAVGKNALLKFPVGVPQPYTERDADHPCDQEQGVRLGAQEDDGNHDDREGQDGDKQRVSKAGNLFPLFSHGCLILFKRYTDAMN